MVLAAAAMVGVLWGLRTVYLGDALTSRLATVHALVHDGTWYIDRPPGQPANPFEPRTIDKVQVRGRLLSSKPPLLPLAMAGEYWLMHHGLGWRLDAEGELKRVVQVMCLTLVGLPFLLGLVWFHRLARWIAGPKTALALLAAAAFGTQLPGYAAVVSNHVPGAAATLACFYLAFGLCENKLPPRPWRFAAFGLAAALVFTLDMPMTVFPALLGLWLLGRFPRPALAWGLVGAAPVLAIHFGIMLAVTGSPLPVQMNRELYLFESSFWRHPLGQDSLSEPKLLYLFHITFGRHGVFLLFPVLVFGLAGMAGALAGKRFPHRPWVLLVTAGFLVVTAYYVKSTNNYGGAAYGFRWYIGAMPLLLLAAAPMLGRTRRWWPWTLFAMGLAVSMYSAWECHVQPWGANHEWTARLLFGPSF